MCSICQSKLFCYTTKLKCGHKYHTKCIKKWSKIHNTCPLCRLEINLEEFNFKEEESENIEKCITIKKKYYFTKDNIILCSKNLINSYNLYQWLCFNNFNIVKNKINRFLDNKIIYFILVLITALIIGSIISYLYIFIVLCNANPQLFIDDILNDFWKNTNIFLLIWTNFIMSLFADFILLLIYRFIDCCCKKLNEDC